MIDFAPGDLAVCVDARPHPIYGKGGLVEGRAYRVTAIGGSGFSIAFPGQPAPGIKIIGPRSRSPSGFWAGNRFRKLNDEPDNAELIQRIKRCKPVKIGQPA